MRLPMLRALRRVVKGSLAGTATKCAALEYAPQGVRVNAVCPGVIGDTEMVGQHTRADRAAVEAMVAMEPIGRLGRAEEIADAVIWLCSEQASFVTGQALAVDGGFMAGQRLGI